MNLEFWPEKQFSLKIANSIEFDRFGSSFVYIFEASKRKHIEITSVGALVVSNLKKYSEAHSINRLI